MNICWLYYYKHFYTTSAFGLTKNVKQFVIGEAKRETETKKWEYFLRYLAMAWPFSYIQRNDWQCCGYWSDRFISICMKDAASFAFFCTRQIL